MLGGIRWLVDPCRAELAPLPCRKPSPAVAGRPLRVSKGGGRSRRRRPGDMERKGLPAAAGPTSSPRAKAKKPTRTPEKNQKKGPDQPAPFSCYPTGRADQ